MKAYKFTDSKKEEYLTLLSEGSLRGDAANAVGVTRQTIIAHKKIDPEFCAACEAAELSSHEEVEDALYMAAISGNTTAMIFYLKNRFPERWRDVNRFESNVTVEQEINVSTDNEFDGNPEAESMLVKLYRIKHGVGKPSPE